MPRAMQPSASAAGQKGAPADLQAIYSIDARVGLKLLGGQECIYQPGVTTPLGAHTVRLHMHMLTLCIQICSASRSAEEEVLCIWVAQRTGAGTAKQTAVVDPSAPTA